MWLKSFFGSFVILFIIGILVFFSPDLQKLFGPGKSVDENNVSKLIDSLMNAPEIHLNYEDSYSKTQKNCLYHTCFDVYKCGGLHKKILVHISKPQRIFEGKIIKTASGLITRREKFNQIFIKFDVLHCLQEVSKIKNLRKYCNLF